MPNWRWPGARKICENLSGASGGNSGGLEPVRDERFLSSRPFSHWPTKQVIQQVIQFSSVQSSSLALFCNSESAVEFCCQCANNSRVERRNSSSPTVSGGTRRNNAGPADFGGRARVTPQWPSPTGARTQFWERPPLDENRREED